MDYSLSVLKTSCSLLLLPSPSTGWGSFASPRKGRCWNFCPSVGAPSPLIYSVCSLFTQGLCSLPTQTLQRKASGFFDNYWNKEMEVPTKIPSRRIFPCTLSRTTKEKKSVLPLNLWNMVPSVWKDDLKRGRRSTFVSIPKHLCKWPFSLLY